MTTNNSRYKSIGITILMLTVTRIIWRLMNPPPQLPADMAPLEKTASHLVHLGFYALMLAMPLTGWLLVSTNLKFDVPTVLYGQVSWPDIPFVGFLTNETGHEIVEFVHSKLAWVAIGLLALHVLGALKHEFSKEEGVLKRMLPGLFGKTAPPQAPARGFFIAFGGAIVLFLAIAFLPGLLSGNSQPSTLETAQAEQVESNWTVDYESSTIAFSGSHDGSTYQGSFGDWSADIFFDPDALDTSKALVTVQTGSATASKKLYSDSLRAGEWLSVQDHPQATVALDNFRPDGADYVGDATLTIKDQSVTVPFTFTLDINGDTALMTGSTSVERKPLNLGQDSDPTGEWVGETVNIDVTVKASRKE